MQKYLWTLKSIPEQQTMNRLLCIAILVISLGGMSGCGTIMRSQTPARLYPAIHVNGEMYGLFSGIWKETREPGPDQSVGQFTALLGFLFTTIDVPISAVTDTVLLPYDLLFKREKVKPQQPPPGDFSTRMATAARSADPYVEVELHKSEDKVAVVSTNGTTIVAVMSVSGIGGAKLTAVGGAWPTNIAIRLSVRNLESFVIKTPQQSVSGSLAHPGNLAISRTNDHIEIMVPQSILSGKSEHLEFSWIDAFRH